MRNVISLNQTGDAGEFGLDDVCSNRLGGEAEIAPAQSRLTIIILFCTLATSKIFNIP